MARVTVFLSGDLFRAVDAEAERQGTSRSAFLQKAVEAYLRQTCREREEAERRRRMEEACTRMDRLAERLGDWDPVPIIRRFRDAGIRSRK